MELFNFAYFVQAFVNFVVKYVLYFKRTLLYVYFIKIIPL